jgi:RNA polymerase sigma-70 factor (ECF subfamily)
MSTKKSNIAEPDAILLQNAREGDHRAFTTIVRNYENLVYSFAFKVCRDREKASETLQDTFVNVYRKLNQFDNRSKFTTWLYSIVTNNCLMKKRQTKLSRTTIPLEELSIDENLSTNPRRSDIIDPSRHTPIDSIMNLELRHILDTAIQQLPMEYRIVFVLRDIEGRPAEETAKILGLSVPAVKSRLRRARLFLRSKLNEYMTL